MVCVSVFCMVILGLVSFMVCRLCSKVFSVLVFSFCNVVGWVLLIIVVILVEVVLGLVVMCGFIGWIYIGKMLCGICNC